MDSLYIFVEIYANVKKTLVLAVDRDDDYGVKANVETPIIGFDQCRDAAVSLGVVDPEDSDVNGLFAALNIYRELSEDGRDVEVALICGDKKVGHISDSVVIDELEAVLKEVQPDRVILVGDGAEDEYVYPIVSSRVPIDSVKKVYVKQAPGLEGAFYIVSRMLNDYEKRKRFLAPLGYLMMMIAMVFTIQGLFAYYTSNDLSYLYSLAWPIVILGVGALVVMYSYNMISPLMETLELSVKNLRSGNIIVTFSILALCLAIGGILYGLYTVWDDHTRDPVYIVVMFASTVLWPIVFAIVLTDAGRAIHNYLYIRKVNRSFMIGTIVAIGLAFIVQSILDIVKNLLGYGMMADSALFTEMVAGFLFMISATLLQANFTRHFRKKELSDEKN